MYVPQNGSWKNVSITVCECLRYENGNKEKRGATRYTQNLPTAQKN